MRQVTQSEADHFPKAMGYLRQLFQVHLRVELNIPQWIEIIDRQIEFLREELRRVRHDGRASRKEQPLRRSATLLSAVKLNRLIPLDVQARHHLPGNRVAE